MAKRKKIEPFGLRGCGGLSTPFLTKDGKINVEETRRYIDWLVEHECHTLVPGSTGVGCTLDQMRILWETAIDAAKNRITILPYVGPHSWSIEEFVNEIKIAEEAGAKALYFGPEPAIRQVMPPPTRIYPKGIGRWNEEIEKAFYEQIKAGMEATDKPVLLYQHASHDDLTPVMPVSFLVKMANEFEQFAALKTNYFDHLLFEVEALKPFDIAIVKGFYEHEYLAALQMGCVGFISVLGAQLPGHIAGIYNAYVAGDYEKALNIIRDLMPIEEIYKGSEFVNPGYAVTHSPLYWGFKHYLLEASRF